MKTGFVATGSSAALLGALWLIGTAVAGVWGDGSFENDDARDWASDCVQSNSIEPVADALQAVLGADFIKTAEGSAAVAAAEVVAAALGKPSRALPPELQAWVQRQSAEQLRQLAPTARKALARVLDPRVSQLRRIWSGGRANEWSKHMADLEARLAE